MLDDKYIRRNQSNNKEKGEIEVPTFPVNNSWKISPYLSSIQSLAITIYLICSVNKERTNISKFAELLKQQSARKQIVPLSIPFLINYCFQNDVDMVSSASNLIINALIGQADAMSEKGRASSKEAPVLLKTYE